MGKYITISHKAETFFQLYIGRIHSSIMVNSFLRDCARTTYPALPPPIWTVTAQLLLNHEATDQWIAHDI